MESIPKFLASMITIVVGVLLCVSFVIATVVVNSARTYHASVIEEIEASGFDEVVIQKCIEAAESDNYVLKIEEVTSAQSGTTGFYQVTLNYKLSAPIFGVVHNGEVVGYASKGTRIIKKLEPGLYLSGSDYGVLLTPWEELIANGDITLDEGGVQIKGAKEEIAGDLIIDDSITQIAGSSFEECINLTGVVIPSDVASIGSEAFYWCTNLESVVFKEGSKCTQIGDWAFYECRSLESFEFPRGLEMIGPYAFVNCKGLGIMTIPASVNSIGVEIFTGCTGLTKIKVEEGNTVYHSAGNCLIETASKTLLQGCQSSVIPDDGSVTSIAKCAFYEHTSLNPEDGVIIPDSVTEIGDSSFLRCTSLEKVTIPNGVTSIGDCAFYSCRSLKKVVIPNSVTSIKEHAFGYCTSLKEVTIPASVTYFPARLFEDCNSLTKITYGGTLDDWLEIELGTYYGKDWNYYVPNYTVSFASGGSMTKQAIEAERQARAEAEAGEGEAA